MIVYRGFGVLCCDFIIRNMKMPKTRRGEKRAKMWKLKNEQRRKQFEERLQERMAGTTAGWTDLSNAVMETAKGVCGESRDQRHCERQMWWWCKKVQQAIKEKRNAYKRWQRERTERSKGRYKEKSRIATRAVAVVKGRAWTEWSQNINTAEGKQKMFKMTKQIKGERKDVIGARYVKDEHGNIKVEEADMQRWKSYFSELLNEENQYELEDHIKVEGPILGVTVKEVEEALQKMKRGKAPGPSGVTANLLKYAGETGV